MYRSAVVGYLKVNKHVVIFQEKSGSFISKTGYIAYVEHTENTSSHNSPILALPLFLW
jgi:hypothetical protein